MSGGPEGRVRAALKTNGRPRIPPPMSVAAPTRAATLRRRPQSTGAPTAPPQAAPPQEGREAPRPVRSGSLGAPSVAPWGGGRRAAPRVPTTAPGAPTAAPRASGTSRAASAAAAATIAPAVEATLGARTAADKVAELYGAHKFTSSRDALDPALCRATMQLLWMSERDAEPHCHLQQCENRPAPRLRVGEEGRTAFRQSDGGATGYCAEHGAYPLDELIEWPPSGGFAEYREWVSPLALVDPDYDSKEHGRPRPSLDEQARGVRVMLVLRDREGFRQVYAELAKLQKIAAELTDKAPVAAAQRAREAAEAAERRAAAQAAAVERDTGARLRQYQSDLAQAQASADALAALQATRSLAEAGDIRARLEAWEARERELQRLIDDASAAIAAVERDRLAAERATDDARARLAAAEQRNENLGPRLDAAVRSLSDATRDLDNTRAQLNAITVRAVPSVDDADAALQLALAATENQALYEQARRLGVGIDDDEALQQQQQQQQQQQEEEGEAEVQALPRARRSVSFARRPEASSTIR